MDKLAIIASQYRLDVSKSLVENCLKTLKEKGVAETWVDVFWVPGALEIPLLAKKLAQKGKYQALIVFGAVFKGQTYHFEQVANECIRGCMNVAYDFELPVIFEVLCVYDPEDAIERAKGTKDNRGVEGAITALKMIDSLKKI